MNNIGVSRNTSLHSIPTQGLNQVIDQIDSMIGSRRMVPTPGASVEDLMYYAGQVKALEDLREVLLR